MWEKKQVACYISHPKKQIFKKQVQKRNVQFIQATLEKNKP